MRLIYIVIIVLSNFIANAQKIESDLIINKIKSEITSFFINEKILDKADVKNSINYVYATELKTQKVLGYSFFGIYRIGAFKSHSTEHILVKQDTSFEILNIKQVDIVLMKIIEFSRKNKMDTETMLFYLKKVIEMYDENKQITH
ncbi:MAG: hypothetical protein KAY50_11490 [Chitinophagaceae bacterium]|nr:hypothetical protein [Chitinophagaceae bacterium]MBP8115970.1 hypothetical protein [Chitinophagaceae bacterium]